jgi:hypothetical protein
LKEAARHVVERIQNTFDLKEVASTSSAMDTKIVDNVVTYMSALSNKKGTNYSDSEHARRMILVALVPPDETFKPLQTLGINI